MLDLIGNPEDQFSQNEAQLIMSSPGMGCSCLQVTFQACCIEEARYLYDQLTALCPILVSWMKIIIFSCMSRFTTKPVSMVSDQVCTNQAVQRQKMARGLKFLIYKVEGWHYPCTKYKGADQLCGYRTADLCLCFHICRKLVFS